MTVSSERGPGAARQASVRRGVAALVALFVAGALAWSLLGGGGGEDESRASGRALEAAAGLDDEELADQVLLFGFEGSDPTTVLAGLGQRQLGGLLLRAANRSDSASGTRLTSAIDRDAESAGRIPPLIAVSQEGGAYREFPDLPPAQTELEIAETGDVAAVEEWARATGAALREQGVDLNLAPVADVATLDSPVADRAFSDDPLFVAQLTAAAIRGCRAAGIACAPLHFPGLGAASQDTSRGPATVSLDRAALSARDLEPFRAAFAQDAPAVVLSLAFYAAYDPVTPGALAPEIATDLLRGQLRFDGVAITDDLGAGAVRAGSSVGEAAVAALIAGADLLQVGAPEDQAGVRNAILKALEAGELTRDRLAEAAGRVLLLKRRLGLPGV